MAQRYSPFFSQVKVIKCTPDLVSGSPELCDCAYVQSNTPDQSAQFDISRAFVLRSDDTLGRHNVTINASDCGAFFTLLLDEGIR